MLFKQVNLLWAILFVCVGSAVCDYCQDNGCKNASRHVLCLYPPGSRINKNSCSGDYILQKLVHNSEIPKIIDAHYELLKPLDGPSTKRLIWDEELAKMAQAWANQCPPLFENDECHSLGKTHSKPVHQNVLVYDATFEGYNWTRILAKWFNAENYRYYFSTPTSIKPLKRNPSKDYPSEYFGNDTAVTRVGCGLIMIIYEYGHFVTSTLHLVCNYST